MLKTLEEEWLDFAGAVLEGLKPSDLQYQDMKKAFFAGATVVHSALLQTADTEACSDEQVMKYFEGVDAEIAHFYTELINQWREKN